MVTAYWLRAFCFWVYCEKKAASRLASCANMVRNLRRFEGGWKPHLGQVERVQANDCSSEVKLGAFLIRFEPVTGDPETDQSDRTPVRPEIWRDADFSD
jgi:hypothetical protein